MSHKQNHPPYAPRHVTCYIPCFNAGQTIRAALDALLAQTAQPDTILLIDDGSAEPLPIQATGNIKIIRHPRNRGLAAARNTALQNCHTPLIAAIDADVLPHPHWLENIIAALNAEQTTGVGGRLDESHTRHPADSWRAIHMAQHWGDTPIINPRFLYGANTLFIAQSLRDIGGYNPACRTNNEDRTISEALYKQNHKLLYTPHPRCRHLRRDTVPSLLKGYWQWHHAAGLENRDFDSWNGIINRINRVNLGIYNHRDQLDQQADRITCRAIDQLIPWMFAACDLNLLHQRTKQHIPALHNHPELTSHIPPHWRQTIENLLHQTNPTPPTPQATQYINHLSRALTTAQWHTRAKTLQPPELT